MNCTPNVRQKCLTFGGVFFMSKYSLEFKLKVVNYCIENHCGCNICANHFGIDRSFVKLWTRRYNESGIDGLKRNNTKYDGFFKIHVVEYMKENHLSANQTCIKFNLGHHSVVSKWERIYNEKGPHALFEERRGRCKKMESKQEIKKTTDMSQKELINEVEYLRMENAYLKKLNALVQKRNQQKEKK